MLPIGPNGVLALATLLPSPLNQNGADSFLSYNYSLVPQGISHNVSCSYAPESPVTCDLATDDILDFNGTCPSG